MMAAIFLLLSRQIRYTYSGGTQMKWAQEFLHVILLALLVNEMGYELMCVVQG